MAALTSLTTLSAQIATQLIVVSLCVMMILANIGRTITLNFMENEK